MWVEILASPPASGRLQNRTGHALPLTDVVIEGNRIRFPMPSEETVADPARVSLVVEGDSLRGEIVDPKGRRIRISGVRAPALDAVTGAGLGRTGRPAGRRSRRMAARGPQAQEQLGHRE